MALPPETVFGTAPAPPAHTNLNAELGFRFYADVAGTITKIRVWQPDFATANTSGPQVGNIWDDATGALLASATFANPTTPSIWNEIALATPLAIVANKVYVVSVAAPLNSWVGYANDTLSPPINNGSHLFSATTGFNNVYAIPAGTFPALNAKTLTGATTTVNTFRDVEFVPDSPPTPPTGGGGVKVGGVFRQKIRLTRQPASYAALDFGHPLAVGLLAAYNLSAGDARHPPINYVGRRVPWPSGASSLFGGSLSFTPLGAYTRYNGGSDAARTTPVDLAPHLRVTLTAFIYLDSAADSVAIEYSPTQNSYAGLLINPAPGYLSCAISSGASSYHEFRVPPISLGKWHAVTMLIDRSLPFNQIIGVTVDRVAQTNMGGAIGLPGGVPFAANQSFFFGARGSSIAPMAGRLGPVFVHRRLLNVGEIHALHTNPWQVLLPYVRALPFAPTPSSGVVRAFIRRTAHTRQPAHNVEIDRSRSIAFAALYSAQDFAQPRDLITGRVGRRVGGRVVGDPRGVALAHNGASDGTFIPARLERLRRCTFVCQFWIDSYGGSKSFMQSSTIFASDRGFWMFPNSGSGAFEFALFTSGTAEIWGISRPSVGRWHDLAVAWDFDDTSTTTRMRYVMIDGVVQSLTQNHFYGDGQAAGFRFPANMDVVAFAASSDGGLTPGPGRVRCLSVYDRVLPQATVRALNANPYQVLRHRVRVLPVFLEPPTVRGVYIRRVVRTAQPPAAVPLDQSNPLARKLIFSGYNFPQEYASGPRNAVNGRTGTPIGTRLFRADQGLVSPRFDGTSNGAAFSLDMSAFNTVTVAYWHYQDVFDDAGDIVIESGPSFNTGNGILVDPCEGGSHGYLVGVGGPSTGNYALTYVTRPSAKAWHHYLWVISRAFGGQQASNLCLIDGKVQSLTHSGAGGVSGNFSNTPLYFAGRTGTSSRLRGSIRNFNMWGRALSVAEGRELYRRSWQLFIPQTQRYVVHVELSSIAHYGLRGTVTVNDTPAPDVTVGLYSRTTMELLATTVTDEDGFYEFTDLNPDATYFVLAFDPAGGPVFNLGRHDRLRAGAA